MTIQNLQIGYIVQSGLCQGYTDVNNGEICGLPLMVAEITDIINSKVHLSKVINNPATYVDSNDVHGIRLNLYILNLLGFREIDKNDAQCPGAPNFHGTAYEAKINGVEVQVIEDNNSYRLCRSTSAPTIEIDYVHDIQRIKTVNGRPLKIDYMIFYKDYK